MWGAFLSRRRRIRMFDGSALRIMLRPKWKKAQEN
jgi:hypothetical protein